MTGNIKKTILVVDDGARQAEAIAKVLRHVGYETVTATRHSEALEKIKSQPLDGLVTDLHMRHYAEKSGLVLAAAFRATRPDAPIFLVTGSPDDVEFAELQKHNIVMLEKPVDFEGELFPAMKAAFGSPSHPSAAATATHPKLGLGS
jgi:CheY-like chemotaxis protein